MLFQLGQNRRWERDLRLWRVGCGSQGFLSPSNSNSVAGLGSLEVSLGRGTWSTPLAAEVEPVRAAPWRRETGNQDGNFREEAFELWERL